VNYGRCPTGGGNNKKQTEEKQLWKGRYSSLADPHTLEMPEKKKNITFFYVFILCIKMLFLI
jgi:hypothetical protein